MKVLYLLIIVLTTWMATSWSLERKGPSQKMYTMYGTHLWGSPRVVYFNGKKSKGGSNFRVADQLVGIPLLIPFQLVNVEDLQCFGSDESLENDYYDNFVNAPYRPKPKDYRPPAPVVEQNVDDIPPPAYYSNGPNTYAYVGPTGSPDEYEKPKVGYQNVYSGPDLEAANNYHQRRSKFDFIDHNPQAPKPTQYHQPPRPAHSQNPPKFDWQFHENYLRQPHDLLAPSSPICYDVFDTVQTPFDCAPPPHHPDAVLGGTVSGYELANNAKDSPYKQYYNVNGYDQAFDALYKEYKSEPAHQHHHNTFEDFLYKKLKNGFFFKKLDKFMKKHEKMEREEQHRQHNKAAYQARHHY